MEVIVQPDAQAMCLLAAQFIVELVRRKPHCVLGLATGSTPIPLYNELIRQHCEAGLDFYGVTTFNLDEYYPIAPTHPQSYRRFMNERLFDHVNIRRERTHVPDGLASEVAAECANYEARIKEAGGLDLQVLGVGTNGHIGFNEPGASLCGPTHLAVLTERTIHNNARFFDGAEAVPKLALTMGIGTILASRHCVLLANGKHKRDAIALLVEGPLTAQCPASALQLHPRATVIVEEDAAGKLTRREYYDHVQQMLARPKEGWRNGVKR